MRSRELRSNPTEAEKRLWRVLNARKLAGVRFNRQHPIGPYICDFVARTPRLVIELDGGQHAEQTRADALRTFYLENQGYRVLRFWNNDVLANTAGVAAEIERVLQELPLKLPSRLREGSGEGMSHPPPAPNIPSPSPSRKREGNARQAADAEGRRGETYAAAWLGRREWTILDRRVKTKAGEVDLVARRPGLVAFVEVKVRKTAAELDHAIDEHRLQRVAAAAELLFERFAQPGDDIASTCSCSRPVACPAISRTPGARSSWKGTSNPFALSLSKGVLRPIGQAGLRQAQAERKKELP